jgi:hypothetical protein
VHLQSRAACREDSVQESVALQGDESNAPVVILFPHAGAHGEVMNSNAGMTASGRGESGCRGDGQGRWREYEGEHRRRVRRPGGGQGCDQRGGRGVRQRGLHVLCKS